MTMMRKAAAAALGKIFELGGRSKVVAQIDDDKTDDNAKKRGSKESTRKTRSLVRKPKARRLTMKLFRESADQLTKLRQSSSSPLDDYFADRSIPDLGLGGSWNKDIDMMCPPSPGQASIEKVESWMSSLTPPPFLARWASEASLSEAIDEPITPISPRTRHMKRRYISQVEYDTHLEKKKTLRRPSDSQVDYNGNVSAVKQNADLLSQLLEQGERIKRRSDEEDVDESRDDYFDEDWSEQPDAPPNCLCHH